MTAKKRCVRTSTEDEKHPQERKKPTRLKLGKAASRGISTPQAIGNAGESTVPHIPKWFSVLEKEIEREESALKRISASQSEKASLINRELAESFWLMWYRFNKLGAIMVLQPAPENYISFEVFPDEWSIKDDFNFASLDSLALIDSGQGRAGDSLIAGYQIIDGEVRFRLIFEFVEGEKYHKYSGWKRHVSRYILYDQPINNMTIESLRKILAGIVKSWYYSHLKKNRNIILRHVRDNYDRVQNFLK